MRLEAGRNQPREATARALADALGLEVEELFPANNERPPGEAGAVQESPGTGRRDEA